MIRLRRTHAARVPAPPARPFRGCRLQSVQCAPERPRCPQHVQQARWYRLRSCAPVHRAACLRAPRGSTAASPSPRPPPPAGPSLSRLVPDSLSSLSPCPSPTAALYRRRSHQRHHPCTTVAGGVAVVTGLGVRHRHRPPPPPVTATSMRLA